MKDRQKKSKTLGGGYAVIHVLSTELFTCLSYKNPRVPCMVRSELWVTGDFYMYMPDGAACGNTGNVSRETLLKS